MPALQTRRPLRFGDCDPSGIAYFPSYLDMLAGVLEELFAAAGRPSRTSCANADLGRRR
jgi:4-hydroxybenzoyl-CoA thioesterase